MIENHEASLTHTIQLQADKDTIENLPIRIAGEKVTITKARSRWASAFRSYEARLVTDIRDLESDLVGMNKRLKDWKPEVAPEDDSPSP
jgi:N-formylglutamate amidohydrolase